MHAVGTPCQLRLFTMDSRRNAALARRQPGQLGNTEDIPYRPSCFGFAQQIHGCEKVIA